MNLRMGMGVGFAALVATVAAAGCNSVLGNSEAQLFEADSSVVDAAGTDAIVADDAAAPIEDSATGDEPDVLRPQEDGAAPSCGPGKKYCFGDCVSYTDPVYGCEADTCTPCSVARASGTCAGGKCAVLACNKGYADCNQDPTDGCETDLSEATHCGSCNAVCGASAPLCAPNGTGFSCTSGCSGQAPTLCGTQCVDLATSRTHCGACNNTCGAVGNAQVTCSASSCQFSCDTGFHACGNSCATNTNPNTCGTSCTPCPVPEHSVATCSAQGACGFVCIAGFHACGSTCVANTSTDSCGNSCTPCVAPAFGTPTCGGNPLGCGFTCDATHHACGATCAENNDVNNCGTTCGTVCPSGPNSTAGCNGTKCTLACGGAFKDCNLNPADGCEVDSSIDGLNCGGCGISCNGEACVGGVCNTPPVDAGAD
jgi:hypothetical protein